MKKFDPLQELDTSPDSEFVKAVDFVVSTPVTDDNMFDEVVLGNTPLVFRLCDERIRLGEIKTDLVTLEKVMAFYLGRENRLPDDTHPHNITDDLLKQIPAQLNDPIAIIQSQTKAYGRVVLTELFETDKHTGYKNPIIVPIHLKNKGRELKLASVYGKSDGFVLNNLSSSLLMYLNREKCRSLFLSHLNTPNIRQRFNRKEDTEKLQIIAELCDLEYNKGRYQLKTTASIAAGHLHQTENDLLFEKDNTPKPTLMQAIKEKISPKQPKRSIPTPTGYKTEEDFQQFKAKITLTRPLTQDEAFDQTMKVYAEFVPMDSPAYKDIEKNITPQIAEQYKQGKFITQQDIQQMRESLANHTMPQARQEFHQAVHQKQSKPQERQYITQQDKGDRER